jgi:hypothetical protein
MQSINECQDWTVPIGLCGHKALTAVKYYSWTLIFRLFALNCPWAHSNWVSGEAFRAIFHEFFFLSNGPKTLFNISSPLLCPPLNWNDKHTKTHTLSLFLSFPLLLQEKKVWKPKNVTTLPLLLEWTRVRDRKHISCITIIVLRTYEASAFTRLLHLSYCISICIYELSQQHYHNIESIRMRKKLLFPSFEDEQARKKPHEHFIWSPFLYQSQSEEKNREREREKEE